MYLKIIPGISLLIVLGIGGRIVEASSVDHIGLEEVSAWMRCEANPSRQRDRGKAPA